MKRLIVYAALSALIAVLFGTYTATAFQSPEECDALITTCVHNKVWPLGICWTGCVPEDIEATLTAIPPTTTPTPHIIATLWIPISPPISPIGPTPTYTVQKVVLEAESPTDQGESEEKKIEKTPEPFCYGIGHWGGVICIP